MSEELKHPDLPDAAAGKIASVRTAEDRQKCDLLIEILLHLRDSKISLRRAAHHAGVPRRQLQQFIEFEWSEVSVAVMQQICAAILSMPARRFALVSKHLDPWRTPTEEMFPNASTRGSAP